MITIKTNHGDISVELFEDKAPISCENFRQYAKDGHFDGTVFHRVIPNFMIQGGGMDETCSRNRPASRSRTRPTTASRISGARWQWRAQALSTVPRRSFSSIFVTTIFSITGRAISATPFFGKVSDGMDVVDTIAAVATGNRGGHQDVPVDPVTIIEVTTEDQA